MRMLKKILIWTAVILVSLMIIVFVASSYILNSFKPKLEQIITDNTGFETKIEGSAGPKNFCRETALSPKI